MSKVGRRKNTKLKAMPKSLSVPEETIKTVHQTSITEFIVQEDSEKKLPEVSLPSPDAADLPCSTSLGSGATKNHQEDKPPQSDAIDTSQKESHKISDMTNKVVREVPKKKKKQKSQKLNNNSKLTDFFPVRRSNRRLMPSFAKEKHKLIEEAILSGKEDGFKIKEFPDKGRGIITTKPILRGDFVMEYHGELIDYEEAKRRESDYGKKENTGCYMYYFKCSEKKYCIDATEESGRLGRLINHSKKGNLRTQPFYLQNTPRLALFAKRDIDMGEELLYDYGDRSKQALQTYPWLAL